MVEFLTPPTFFSGELISSSMFVGKKFVSVLTLSQKKVGFSTSLANGQSTMKEIEN